MIRCPVCHEESREYGLSYTHPLCSAAVAKVYFHIKDVRARFAVIRAILNKEES